MYDLPTADENFCALHAYEHTVSYFRIAISAEKWGLGKPIDLRASRQDVRVTNLEQVLPPPFLCAHKKQIGQTYTVGPGLRVGLKKGASRDACRPASSSSMTMSCSFSSLLMISGW